MRRWCFKLAILLLVFTSASGHSHHGHSHGHHHDGHASGSGSHTRHSEDSKCSGGELNNNHGFPMESPHTCRTTTLRIPHRVVGAFSSYDRYTLTYTSAFLTSTVSLVGIVLLPFAKFKTLPSSLTSLLLAFSSGALLSDVLLHLLPHSYAHNSHAAVANLALLGALVFSIFSRLLVLTHNLTRGKVTDGTPNKDTDHAHDHHYHRPVAISAYLNLAADSLHNFNDGLAVASAFTASIPAGLATTVAVILHELPQELADYALLVEGGFSPFRALLANFLSATAALAGAALTLHLGDVVGEKAEGAVMPFAAGGLLYLAVAGVMREVEEMDSKRSTGECLIMMVRDVMAAGAGAAVVGYIESGIAH